MAKLDFICKEIEIPEGYEARIEGNKVILEPNESKDERIRKFLIDYFTSYKIGNVATKLNGYRIDDILAYLEKQKEQKQEWSDEDKRILKGIIGLVDHNQHYNVSNKEMLAWLKSLRSRVGKEFLQPHWEPSEEQIGALNYAYCELYKREDVGHNILGSLQELCDELRELM